MLDWGTYAIEAVGLVIMCVWIVVPAREFKRIFKSLKEKDEGSSFSVQRSSSSGDAEPRTRNEERLK